MNQVCDVDNVYNKLARAFTKIKALEKEVTILKANPAIPEGLSPSKTIASVRTSSITDSSVYIIDNNKQGHFNYDSTDSTSLDNGSTIILDSANRRFKRDIESSYNFKWFGGIGDNSTDNSSALQLFIDFCSVTGVEGYIPEGRYILLSPVNLKDNLTLRFSDKAVLIRKFVGSSNHTTAVFKQASYLTPINNVKLVNPQYDIFDTTMVGRFISIWCNNFIAENILVNRFRGAQALILAGDRMRIYFPEILGPGGITGEGGIRYVGGNDFMCIGGVCDSGDDGFQFVPSASPSDPLFNMDITKGSYVGCRGTSTSARFFVVATEENNTCLIKDVSFIDMKGFAGTWAAYLTDQSYKPFNVTNTSGNYNIARVGSTITFTTSLTNRNFSAFDVGQTVTIAGASDTSLNITGNIATKNGDALNSITYTITSAGAATVGPVTLASGATALTVNKTNTKRVSGITLSNCTLDGFNSINPPLYMEYVSDVVCNDVTTLNGYQRGVEMTQCNNVTFNSLNIRAPRVSALEPLIMNNCDNVFVGGNSNITANLSDGVLIGSGSTSRCTNIRFNHVNFYGISAAKFGLNFNNVLDGTIANSYFESSKTTPTGGGFRVSTLCNRINVSDNNFQYVAAPVTDLISGSNPLAVKYRNNNKYITANKGQATAASGAATTITVTHGLSYTPDLGDIQVTPLGALGTGNYFWVSSPTSTTFTINMGVAAGFAIIFSWSAGK